MTDENAAVLDRRRWDHDASQALLPARHKPWPLSLILVDLDRFKDINDLYGHPAGDAVLRAAATALRHHSGERGIVGRYGGHTGDEFLILLPDTNLEAALAVARSIQVHISSLSVPAMTSCESAVTITGWTVSMGVAASTDLIPGDLSELLLECDVALRDAKRSGGNQICIAGSQAATSHHERNPTVEEVRQLADGEVRIPLTRLPTGNPLHSPFTRAVARVGSPTSRRPHRRTRPTRPYRTMNSLRQWLPTWIPPAGRREAIATGLWWDVIRTSAEIGYQVLDVLRHQIRCTPGPVIADLEGREPHLYFLVRRSTAHHWSAPGSRALGKGWFIVVPSHSPHRPSWPTLDCPALS
ncbi:hypothetical protein SANTM175S_08429 [Streptomyces antimycoticus]